MKRCSACGLTQADATAVCDCGAGLPLPGAISDADTARIYAEERLRFKARRDMEGAERRQRASGFVWVGVVVLASILLLLVGGIASDAGKSPEDLARERARACMNTWQEHYASQGYNRDMIQIGAVMKCSQELKALDRYDKTKH